MITNAIARRYAKALIQLAVEEQAVERFNGELARAAALLDGNRELTEVFTNPAYGGEAKQALLQEVLQKLALSPLVGNLLRLLLERNRLGLLPQIAHSFGMQADALSGVVRPTIVTAQPLDDGQVAGIRAALERLTGKQVALAVETDPALIGGVVAKIGDKLFDGSVRTQLSRIQDTLQKG